MAVNAHYDEVLACDWNKISPNILATGSVDKTIKIWDLRKSDRPLRTLFGHSYAITSLDWSPHSDTLLASTSYDLSCATWNTTAEKVLIERFEHHKDMVVGVSFNRNVDMQIATCGWDGVYLFVLGSNKKF